MKQEVVEKHNVDESGNPTGGTTTGTGILIEWQNGPLGDGVKTPKKEPNGAFVEGVIAAARGRLAFFQTASGGRFAHSSNQQAIEHLEAALACLETRTQERQARGVEGTHTV